jgi:hypothetical protein
VTSPASPAASSQGHLARASAISPLAVAVNRRRMRGASGVQVAHFGRKLLGYVFALWNLALALLREARLAPPTPHTAPHDMQC